MRHNRLLALVESILSTHEDELDCDGCDAAMPYLAELVSAGGDPALILPAVQEHLRRCGACREEFEALVAIVRAESAGMLVEDSGA